MNNSLNRTTVNILNTLKKSFFISLSTIALSVGVAQTAKADVVTFDDITTNNYKLIQNGYVGFIWNNFFAGNTQIYHNTSGYKIGTVSGNNVAFNGWGSNASISSSSKTLFDFNSAFLTSAIRDSNTITVRGLSGGVSKYLTTVVVDNKAPRKFDFNFLGVDTVQFSSHNSTHFAMDNFTFSKKSATPVPEPGLLTGLFIITPFVVASLKRKKIKEVVQ